QWVPDNTGLFRPQNINKVKSYGGELEVFLKHTIGSHHLQLNSGYSYTVSENEATDKQLIYVPIHKANINFGYSFKVVELFYQHLFNGEVDIIGGQLNCYDVGNLGLSYTYEISKNVHSILQFNINN